jgi:hypothetical protein
MRYTLSVITIFLSSTLNVVFAQAIIKGKVFDRNTLEPLQGVYVLYQKNQGTTSSVNGYFLIKSERYGN